ncbi:MAG: molybdopterin-dependent oxidoreductase, partial [Pseudonocardia sediminis]
MPSDSTQTASHWGVYRVRTDPGTGLLSADASPLDPHPSPLRHGLPEAVRDRSRIDRPHVREGWLRHRGASRADRGSEPFVPVDWDTALDLVTDALTDAKERLGNESIYGGSYGWASAGRLHHAPSALKRFLGMFGGYVDKIGNHSFGAALAIAPYVLGRNDIGNLVVRWPELVAHTRLLVLFGGAASKNGQNDAGGAIGHETPDRFAQARAAGMEVVCISPSRDDVPDGAQGADWIPIRPGTDVAMMLALAHTLVADGRADRAFLESACVGYPEFERHLTGADDGRPKDAAWASAICGVPAATIEGLARRMAGTRTLVNTSWSVQRADHGEQPIWATVALAAVLGQIGLPGGGFALGFGAVSGNSLPRPDGIPRPTLDLGHNPVTTAVPVGRVHEMLLHPGTDLPHDGGTIRLPEIEVVHSAGGNPFHHNLNLNRFVRAWQRPGTVIVHEPWWSPPARFADIVLPSTTTMERDDVAATEHSRYWVAMKQVIAPYAHSRHDL